jgi:ABC-type transport system involved in multi-copper enzyme maturation permease subunit
MRAFLEIFRFECRMQVRSPLFIALVALFVVIHFLTARKVGIDIGIGAARDAAGLPLNAALAIIQNELVLSLFAIFPAVAIVAAAITRDHERITAELFFVRPIRAPSYVLGRFMGGLVFALLVSLAGVAGGLIALTAPGVDPERLVPFAAAPWWFVLVALVVPNTLIVAALAFSAAAAARSIAAAFCVALVLPLVPVIAVSYIGIDGAGWLTLLDPFGAIAMLDVTRYWTGAELASELPGGSVWVNRALWLGVAAAALLATLARYRFVVQRPRSKLWRALSHAATPAPALSGARSAPRFDVRGTASQLASQLRIDLGTISRSPPFYLVVALVVLGCAQHFSNVEYGVDPETLGIPSLPTTSLLIGFFSLGLALQLVLMIAYYAGVLAHRERQARVADMADASPVSSAIPVLGKIGALWIALTLLLAAGVVTFVVLQAASGYTRFELGIYLKAIMFYGFNHYMLVVPAVLIHVLLTNRWLAMLAFLVTFATLLSLTAFGLEDLLYAFRLPFVPHSDMNGFGHYAPRQAWLIAYWSAFLVFLTVVACWVKPRGYYDRLALRLADVRSRVTRGGTAVAAAAIVAFAAVGSWIFYNTHVLNEYVTTSDLETRAADYEKKYRRYADLWVPQPTAVDIAVDFFPAERRVQSRGSARLVNDSSGELTELFVTLNPEIDVNALAFGDAELVEEDAVLGVRRYRFAAPLPAGNTVVATWDFTWRNDGFRNAVENDAVAANGTFLDAPAVMPTLGYTFERELVDSLARRRQGLAPAVRMADLDGPVNLGDPRNRFVFATYRAVVGTSDDQTAVAAGTLQREWRESGRRYFEYSAEFPAFALAFATARYEVLRDEANGVPIEIFHDPKHAAGVATMMETTKRGLEYYQREFAPYAFEGFRIFEYPRYSTRVRALAAVIAFQEGVGFSSRHRNGGVDMATAHELAHMWWGGQVRSSYVQGRQVLNETLANYSALMLIEEVEGRAVVYAMLPRVVDYYLDARSREPIEELPVVRAETDLIAYNKAAHVMYALRDVLGADRVHLALRRMIEKYGSRPPPYPTTRELVAELRAVAGAEHQALITALLERITFYDLAVTGTEVHEAGGDEFDVTIDIAARQLDADGAGVETEVPLDAPFDIAVFADGVDEPLYLEKHRLTSGSQRIVVRVPARPAHVAVDPYRKMIDPRFQDNVAVFRPL